MPEQTPWATSVMTNNVERDQTVFFPTSASVRNNCNQATDESKSVKSGEKNARSRSTVVSAAVSTTAFTARGRYVNSKLRRNRYRYGLIESRWHFNGPFWPRVSLLDRSDPGGSQYPKRHGTRASRAYFIGRRTYPEGSHRNWSTIYFPVRVIMPWTVRHSGTSKASQFPLGTLIN
jgi:hypothetical protein